MGGGRLGVGIRALAAGIILAAVASARAGPAKPNILFIVADDLGYNDLGHYNGGSTKTPNIDQLIAAGISLTSYNTYTICSPSRASIHSGRYPCQMGWYDMTDDDFHSLQNYTTLPQLLKANGYSTHAFGKYDLGHSRMNDTAFRIYDTWSGYLTAALTDYWRHYTGTAIKRCKHDFITDLSMTNGSGFRPIKNKFGIYDRSIFSDEFEQVVAAHHAAGSTQPLFAYLAFQNVHAAGGNVTTDEPISLAVQAPCDTIDRAARNIKGDLYKGQAGMLLELDYGVGNATAVLDRYGYLDNTLIVFVSDNGGPNPHSANYPYRGGKHGFYEGGVRVVAFVGGPMIPKERRGTEWSGLAHSSDWYTTLVEGVAGGQLPANTGIRPPDGVNLWPALMSGGASPRTEVVHQVSNQYFDMGVQSMRMGDFKIIVGTPGDNRSLAFPKPGQTAVPFGLTGGLANRSANRCEVDRSSATWIKAHCSPACLYNVVTDPSENHDLAGDPQYSAVLRNLTMRLAFHASRARPQADVLSFADKASQQAAMAKVCKMANNTGWLQPSDKIWNPPAPAQ